MKTLAVLPARYASARFPGKPLALIAGKPMIQWVWEAAVRACVDRVAVATDDGRIASAVSGFGGEAIMTGPGLPSGSDRVAAAMGALAEKFDLVLNIQGDEPAMHHETVASLVRMMAEQDDLPMGTAACPFSSPEEMLDPNTVKVVLDKRRRALYFSRSPIPFVREAAALPGANSRSGAPPEHLPLFNKHLGIYAYRPRALEEFRAAPPCLLEKAEMLEQLRALYEGIAIGVAETPHDSIGVDTPEDIPVVEEILKTRRFR